MIWYIAKNKLYSFTNTQNDNSTKRTREQKNNSDSHQERVSKDDWRLKNNRKENRLKIRSLERCLWWLAELPLLKRLHLTSLLGEHRRSWALQKLVERNQTNGQRTNRWVFQNGLRFIPKSMEEAISFFQSKHLYHNHILRWETLSAKKENACSTSFVISIMTSTGFIIRIVMNTNTMRRFEKKPSEDKPMCERLEMSNDISQSNDCNMQSVNEKDDWID